MNHLLSITQIIHAKMEPIKLIFLSAQIKGLPMRFLLIITTRIKFVITIFQNLK